MTRTALLNNVDHGELCVAVAPGAEPGDAANQMLVVPTEFEDAARDHPVLFRRGGDGWQAVVLLGFDRDENLHIADGRWNGTYRPAVQRRGPFLIGFDRTEGGEEPRPVIRILIDDPRIGREGEPIFLPEGGNAPYLDGVGEALRTLHAGVETAPAMFAAFEAAGLLRPVTLEVVIDEDTRYDIGGVWTIDADRLSTLDGPTLAALNRDGFLGAAFHVLASLGNVRRLIARRQGMAA